jgi:hypothetical protein
MAKRRNRCQTSSLHLVNNYGVVENAHLVINHILVDYFKKRLMASRPWLV